MDEHHFFFGHPGRNNSRALQIDIKIAETPDQKTTPPNFYLRIDLILIRLRIQAMSSRKYKFSGMNLTAEVRGSSHDETPVSPPSSSVESFPDSTSSSPGSDFSQESVQTRISKRFVNLIRAQGCESSRPSGSSDPFKKVDIASGSGISSFRAVPPQYEDIEFFLERENCVISPGADLDGVKNQIVIGASTTNQSIQKNNRVWGMDVDRSTRKMYVADKVSHQVRVYTAEGVQLAQFGNELLRDPTGIAVDLPNKRIIVSSKQTHRICIFNLDGEFITSFGGKGFGVGRLHFPWGVAVSPTGDMIVVADSRNHRVQTFDKLGNVLNSYSVYEVNPYKYVTELDYPRGVCFDERGKHIYAVDFNINAIFKFTRDLSEKTTVVPPGRLIRPQGLTVDEAGNILVCDSGNSVVRVIKPCGSLLANIHADGEFNYPQDLAILPQGQLAILDGCGVIRFY